MSKETQKLTHGAMITALLGVLFLVDRQSAGLFNYIIGWIVPLPILVYVAQYGFKQSLAPFFASILLAFIVATPVTAVYALIYGVIGLIYGFGVYNKWSARALFYATVGGTSVVFFISVLLFASFFGYNLQQEIQTINDIIEAMDVSAAVNTKTMVQTTLVVMYATSVLLEAFVIHTLAKLILSRFKIKVIKSGPLESVRFPKWVGIIILLTLFAYPLTVSLNLDEMYQTIGFAIYSWNVLLLTYQAFVFVIIMQRRYKLKFLVWMVILGMLFMPTIMIDIMMIIGLLDILSDIRSRLLGVKDHA